MFNLLKKIIKKILTDLVRTISHTKLGAYGFEKVLNEAMQTKQSLKHGQTELVFTIPNQLNRFRINTFSSKEPETSCLQHPRSLYPNRWRNATN